MCLSGHLFLNKDVALQKGRGFDVVERQQRRKLRETFARVRVEDACCSSQLQFMSPFL